MAQTGNLPITEASMGYVGSLQMTPETAAGSTSSARKVYLRVTSCDVKTSQEITYPEVIDGRIDTTLFQLGPKITGGTVAFPLVHEQTYSQAAYQTDQTACGGDTENLAATLWKYAASRNGRGRLENKFTAHVRYSDNTAFDYPGCYINSMTWNVVQSEAVSAQVELFGGIPTASAPGGRAAYSGEANPSFLSPTRIVTWNDARVDVVTPIETLCFSHEIREFTVTLNNGLERIYTLNNTLAVFDVAAKKREISGTLKTMGRVKILADHAWDNERYSDSRGAGIGFGYALGGGEIVWATGFYGVIFSIEEMAMTTGIFECTHNWRALGDCTHDYLATAIGSADVQLEGNHMPYPSGGMQGGDDYGGTGTDFPNF